MKHALVALSLLFFAACETAPAPPSQSATADVTVLVSIDGFRPDYMGRGFTPTLDELARTGAKGSMSPSFPSLTFPNHYALVTGLTPDHSGLVGNNMEDAARPGVTFGMSNRAVASDPIWWEQGEPIWVTAQKQGLKTATMFWPGSDYVIHGVRPDNYRDFDQNLMSFSRVDQLLTWLDKPAAQRARFGTLYFDIVDTAGHRWGPGAPETMGAVAEVDAAIARFAAGLKAKGIAANLVIVADHGMAATPSNQTINLDQWITKDVARTIYTGAIAMIAPQPGREEDAAKALVGRKEHGECWRKQDLPKAFGYGTNPRVAPIICLADIGWKWRAPSQYTPMPGPDGGEHGFDPNAPEMAALFIANGPAIRAGVTLPKFRNVSVYPLLAKLTGVPPRANDGQLADTAAALR